MVLFFKPSFLFCIFAAALGSGPTAYAQGFPGGEPPPAFSILQAVAHNENQGIKDQLATAINVPVYLGIEWMIFSGLQFQNINLANHPMSQVPHYNFTTAQLSLNARSNSASGDGWIIGLNAGSSSDEIFASSDVVTYSLQIQRKNKWSDTSAIYYGFVYSNNNALLPGLPFPTFAYEYQSLDKEDLYRFGVPTIIRLKNILPQTTLSAFAIGPVIWDLRIINKSIQPTQFSVGFSKRPETFLISHPASSDPDLRQLMIDQTSFFISSELELLTGLFAEFKWTRNFENKFVLRETASTNRDNQIKNHFEDYSLISFSLKYYMGQK